MITFRQMEIFAGIVAHGSFRRCADHLGISPEAVSANMRALEDNLGYYLFERRPGGPALLTSLGRRAFQHASNILDDLSYLYDTSEGSTSRKIVLGAHPYIMRYLQPGIDAFRAQHPEVILSWILTAASRPIFPKKSPAARWIWPIISHLNMTSWKQSPLRRRWHRNRLRYSCHEIIPW